MNIDLLLVDVQNDFCSPEGTLYVPNAENDCKAIAHFIYKNMDKIDTIHMTLDTHPFYHIAHPIFWKDANGNHPPVYTQITSKDFANGIYQPVDPSLNERVRDYLFKLESRSRYNLIIWPPHCLLATWGACINKEVYDAVHEWETKKPGRSLNFVLKAMNPLTEHYSAIQAEVPDPADPNTRTNFMLIDKIKGKSLYVAGEALSHCVSNTIKDMCTYISASQITLLTDCTSNVAGFEQIGKEFFDSYTSKGMKSALSTDLI
ncbi:MAG: hypothetical protein J6B81_02645 [Spirochaetaceae bacterium]|nr:hypothetical protein [Spirochaetaceae bacterium]